jgi:hypothetical protein
LKNVIKFGKSAAEHATTRDLSANIGQYGTTTTWLLHDNNISLHLLTQKSCVCFKVFKKNKNFEAHARFLTGNGTSCGGRGWSNNCGIARLRLGHDKSAHLWDRSPVLGGKM